MNNEKLGQIYAILAFFIWGAIAPIYFKQVASVEPIEVLKHSQKVEQEIIKRGGVNKNEKRNPIIVNF